MLQQLSVLATYPPHSDKRVGPVGLVAYFTWVKIETNDETLTRKHTHQLTVLILSQATTSLPRIAYCLLNEKRLLQITTGQH